MEDRVSGNDRPVAALLLLLHQARISVAVVFLLGLAAAVAVAVFTRPVYRSQVVVAISAEGGGAGLSSLLSQFGGLASLAGANLPATGGMNRHEAVAVLSSREFTGRFIEHENLLPALFEKDWDSAAKKWRVEVSKVPTLGDGVKRFEERVRRVNMDEVTGLVTVAVDWYDRELAAQWANKLVASANEELRARAIAEARRSLSYLESEAEKTSITQVRDAIYSLVENQIKTIMLANVREQYVFKVLDPAIVSDENKFVWPRRVLIIGLGVIFSALLAIGWVLSLAMFSKLRSDYRESVKLR